MKRAALLAAGMHVRPFDLERFVARHEHSARFVLGSSGVAPFPLAQVPALDLVRLAAEADAPGDPVFARAIARARGVPEAHVFASVGDTEAIFVALFSLVSPKDRVLVERPAYFPFVEVPRALGARVERFDRSFASDWRFDVDDVIRRLDQDVSCVVLASPNNPSGRVTPARDLVRLAEACAEVDAWLFVDEVFRSVVQPRAPPAHALHPRIVSAESLTKAHGLSTLRGGWVLASPELAEPLRATRGITTIHGGGLLPRIAAHVLAREDAVLQRTLDVTHRNLARFRAFMQAHPAFSWREPDAPLFATVRLPQGTDDIKFVEALLAEEGVMVVPGSFLELPGHVRVGFGAASDVFVEGVTRLERFVAKLSGAG